MFYQGFSASVLGDYLEEAVFEDTEEGVRLSTLAQRDGDHFSVTILVVGDERHRKIFDRLETMFPPNTVGRSPNQVSGPAYEWVRVDSRTLSLEDPNA